MNEYNELKRYNDLECSILSCILIKPDFMEKTVLEDKHFVNYQKIWIFMKSFYKKFGNFDLTLMCSVCKNQRKLLMYIKDLIMMEPTICHFQEYENQLIYLFNEEEKDKWIIKKTYETTCDLWTRNITTKEFKTKIDDIYSQANEIFKKY